MKHLFAFLFTAVSMTTIMFAQCPILPWDFHGCHYSIVPACHPKDNNLYGLIAEKSYSNGYTATLTTPTGPVRTKAIDFIPNLGSCAGYYTVGSFMENLGGISHKRAFLTQYNDDLGINWTYSYSIPSIEPLYFDIKNVKTLNNGDALIMGMIIYNYTLGSASFDEAFVARINQTTGNIVWFNQVTNTLSTTSSYVNAAVEDIANNKIIICGKRIFEPFVGIINQTTGATVDLQTIGVNALGATNHVISVVTGEFTDIKYAQQKSGDDVYICTGVCDKYSGPTMDNDILSSTISINAGTTITYRDLRLLGNISTVVSGTTVPSNELGVSVSVNRAPISSLPEVLFVSQYSVPNPINATLAFHKPLLIKHRIDGLYFNLAGGIIFNKLLTSTDPATGISDWHTPIAGGFANEGNNSYPCEDIIIATRAERSTPPYAILNNSVIELQNTTALPTTREFHSTPTAITLGRAADDAIFRRNMISDVVFVSSHSTSNFSTLVPTSNLYDISVKTGGDNFCAFASRTTTSADFPYIETIFLIGSEVTITPFVFTGVFSGTKSSRSVSTAVTCNRDSYSGCIEGFTSTDQVDPQNVENKAVIYPNPFENAPFIHFNNTAKHSTLMLTVTDITGKVVIKQSFELGEGRNELTLLEFAGLRNGVYFTQIQIDDIQLSAKKLLKVK